MRFFNMFFLILILWQINSLKSDTLSYDEILLNLIKTRKACDVNLDGINLIDLDLSKVDMAGVKIRKANILKVNLSNSNLTNADMEGSNFFGSILIKTNFKGANLNDSQNLHKAVYQKCARFPINWFKQEYNKNNLDLQQLNKILSAGYAICQNEYSLEELKQLKKFNIT